MRQPTRRPRCFWIGSFLLPFFASQGLSAGPSAPVDEPYLASLIEQARARDLAHSRAWQVLLHYRIGWLGWKSEIDDPGFFNSPRGLRHPDAELEATLRAFYDPAPAKVPTDDGGTYQPQHKQCRFIDRYRWLKSVLRFDPKRLPEAACPEFEAWDRDHDTGGATLIFASYYMGNSASMFGHTLLRLNNKGHEGKGERLLDYGVNYAANPTTKNPFLYTVMGLAGGFRGDFANIPYYLKVEEYSNMESRDLWEYELNLTQAEVDRMMEHLWSVGHSRPRYYFFDRNCSYMMLGALEAARPTLFLSERFGGWVIPADTIRAVSEAGLLKDLNFRPSLATRIAEARERLSPEEDRLFKRVSMDADERAAALKEARGLPKGSAVRVMDASLEYYRYLRQGAPRRELPPADQAFQRQLLAARASLQMPSPEVPAVRAPDGLRRPDAGHRTQRAALEGGYESALGGFVGLSYRPAFHDLNSPPDGYPPHSNLEILATKLRYYPSAGRLALERLDLLRVTATNPWDPVFRKKSYAFDMGWETTRDAQCLECAPFHVGGGYGFSLGDRNGAFGASLIPEADLELGGGLSAGYRLGLGGEVLFLGQFTGRLGLMLGAQSYWSVLGAPGAHQRALGELRFAVTQSWEARAAGSLWGAAWEGVLTLGRSF